ncbi:MAG: hypothetical protein IKZ89_02885 [Bacteroidaceae bacterium]|nr:hypothetical protein [Bacteroidaceae bacterium]
MRKKVIVAVVAMATVVAANLFVISAKQGNVKCQNLLSSSLLLNKIAYANDPGSNNLGIYGRRELGTVSCKNYNDGKVTEIHYTVSNTSAKSRQLKSDFNLNVGVTAPLTMAKIQGEADAKWGANKESENSLANSFSGVWVIDIRSATGVKVACDGEVPSNCIEDYDPCTTLYARAYQKFLDYYIQL